MADKKIVDALALVSRTAALPARIGAYRVLRHLASGGMAEVFLGETGDGVPVAIKRLLPRLAKEPGFLEMFFDEAALTARLRHPNIVRVLEIGEDEGDLYVAMEYLHGRTLNALARIARRKERPIPLGVSLHAMLSVCLGLHYAHERRGDDGRPLDIVHRDVSPQNIVLTYDGQVKLVDFGIAKSTQQATQTRTGMLKGKVAYMSPEHCLGSPVDRRTDVFSAGIVLWELTVGRRLYRGRTDFDRMRAIVDGEVTPPSQVDPTYDPGLEKVVLRALEKNRARRYQSARELGDALGDVIHRLGVRIERQDVVHFFDEFCPEATASWRRAQDAGTPLVEYFATAPVDDEASESDSDVHSTPRPGAPRRWVLADTSAPPATPTLRAVAGVSASRGRPSVDDGEGEAPLAVEERTGQVPRYERANGALTDDLTRPALPAVARVSEVTRAQVPALPAPILPVPPSRLRRRGALFIAPLAAVVGFALGLLAHVLGGTTAVAPPRITFVSPPLETLATTAPRLPELAAPTTTPPTTIPTTTTIPSTTTPTPTPGSSAITSTASAPTAAPAAPMRANVASAQPSARPAIGHVTRAASPARSPARLVRSAMKRRRVRRALRAPAIVVAPGQAAVRIETRPRCSVRLDGALVGYSPMTVTTTPGDHVLLLGNTAQRVVRRLPVSLVEGAVQVQRLDLRPDANAEPPALETDPPAAP